MYRSNNNCDISLLLNKEFIQNYNIWTRKSLCHHEIIEPNFIK